MLFWAVVAGAAVGAVGLIIVLAIIGWGHGVHPSNVRLAARVGTILVLALAILAPVVAGVAFFASRWSPLGPYKQPVDCARVATFVDRPDLPDGLANAHCTLSSFTEQYYQLTGDVDRAALERWLVGLPDAPVLKTTDCDGHDFCTTRIDFNPPAKGGADGAGLVADQTSDGRLHIEFSAFNS